MTKMASSHAEIFEALRITVLETLVANRNSIDDAFDGLSEDSIRRHFETVLIQMRRYIESPSPAHLHESVATWVATLLSLGLTPRSVLRSVVTLGDLIVQVSKEKIEPSASANLFLLDVVRMNFNAARAVVALLNDELQQRNQQLERGGREAN